MLSYISVTFRMVTYITLPGYFVTYRNGRYVQCAVILKVLSKAGNAKSQTPYKFPLALEVYTVSSDPTNE